MHPVSWRVLLYAVTGAFVIVTLALAVASIIWRPSVRYVARTSAVLLILLLVATTIVLIHTGQERTGLAIAVSAVIATMALGGVWKLPVKPQKQLEPAPEPEPEPNARDAEFEISEYEGGLKASGRVGEEDIKITFAPMRKLMSADSYRDASAALRALFQFVAQGDRTGARQLVAALPTAAGTFQYSKGKDEAVTLKTATFTGSRSPGQLNEAMQARIDALESQLTDVTGQRINLTDERDELQKNLIKQEATVRALQERQEEQDATVSDLRQIQEVQQREYNASVSGNRDLHDQLTRSQADLTSAKSDLEGTRTQNAELRTQLNNQDKRVSVAQKQQQKLQIALSDATEQIETMEKTITNMQNQHRRAKNDAKHSIRSMQNTMAEERREMQTVQHSLDECKKTVKTLRKEVTTSIARTEQLERELKATEETVKQKEDENRIVGGTIRDLEERIRQAHELTERSEKLKVELKAAQATVLKQEEVINRLMVQQTQAANAEERLKQRNDELNQSVIAMRANLAGHKAALTSLKTTSERAGEQSTVDQEALRTQLRENEGQYQTKVRSLDYQLRSEEELRTQLGETLTKTQKEQQAERAERTEKLAQLEHALKLAREQSTVDQEALRTQLREKEGQYQQSTVEQEALRAQLQEKEGQYQTEIRSLDQQLRSEQGERTQREETLTEQQKQLDQLTKKLRQQTRLKAQQDKQNAEKDAEIAMLTGSLIDQAFFESQQDELKERTERVTQLQREKAALEARNEQMQAALKEVRESGYFD